MNVSIKVIEVLFNNHSFITFYLFIYLLLWHFSGTHVSTCVQVATPLLDAQTFDVCKVLHCFFNVSIKGQGL